MPAMPKRALSRRAALSAAGLAAGSAAASRRAGAQPPADPARPRGPAVWLDFDQAALDAAYDQASHAPNMQQVLGRYATNSRLVREAVGPPTRAAYGPLPVEGLDLYRARGVSGSAPVLVFLHGGAWRSGLARDSAFAAECFVRAGAHFVVPDFSWVQDRDGDLLPIADQVRRAVAWTARHAASFGGDPARVFVAGHSSGAHLASLALTTEDWSAHGAPADVLKGGLLVSGPYDMRPVRLSARSRYVRFTDESEAALSATRRLEHLRAPVVVAHGGLETPEFARQSRDFAAAVAAAGKPVRTVFAEGYNHFEVIETMASPYGPVGRAGLAMVGLAAG